MSTTEHAQEKFIDDCVLANDDLVDFISNPLCGTSQITDTVQSIS
ncbi:MAG: hypothetical protein P8K80_00890 [Phycisphaerales bacterium]|nr:hypothetical protein [Phycisphaerales bacterium]